MFLAPAGPFRITWGGRRAQSEDAEPQVMGKPLVEVRGASQALVVSPVNSPLVPLPPGTRCPRFSHAPSVLGDRSSTVPPSRRT